MGTSVAMSGSGDVVAAGAPADSFVDTNAGRVVALFFDRDTFLWVRIDTDFSGDANGDQCGCSVSLSVNGTTLAFGCPGSSGTGPANSGRIRTGRCKHQESFHRNW